MSKQDKDLIVAYRNEGLSYHEIAEKVGVSEQFCRTVCSRANRKKQHSKPEPAMGLCPECGKLLVNLPGHKPKKYCSDACRYKAHNWEKMHKPYIRTCEVCQREFVAYGYPNKRFCSRECQNIARKGGENDD